MEVRSKVTPNCLAGFRANRNIQPSIGANVEKNHQTLVFLAQLFINTRSQGLVFSSFSCSCLQLFDSKNNKLCVCAQWCPILRGPMDFSPPDSSVHGIFQQEYWSGLPFPTPREPTSFASPALAGGFFTTAPPGKPPNFSPMHTVKPRVDFFHCLRKNLGLEV